MKCSTKSCRRSAAKNRKQCHTCRSANYRKKHPIRSAYLNLKANSKRRGIEFTLTLDQFNDFCFVTEYVAGKGRSRDSFTIDRIDNSRGYTVDNIQVMTKSANSSKGKKILVFDYEHPDQTHVRTVKSFQRSPDDPF